ncbi:MAG: collagen-like protein [Oscillospiraceae bacterium]|nr:collagen-like protein [Oscillospiraceae bacterium]
MDYLTVEIHRDSPEWEDLHLHIFFQHAGRTFELLTDGDFIGTSAHLNLEAGEWSVSVVGYDYEDDLMVEKITTNTIGFTVAPAPPDAGESLPYTPPSAFEQVEAIALSVRADADSGKFNGAPGAPGEPGEPGAPGQDGTSITVTGTTVGYQDSSSGTTIPSGTWSPTIPAVTPGDFLWTKVVTEFSDGAQAVSYSVARMGIDGSGSVSTVCNVSPDSDGNVQLTAADVGAKPSSYSAPVDSVNNKTGAVVLGASDVGALPDTYAAPVSSVNGQTGAVVLTAADVGAKPSSYSAPVESVNSKTGAVVLTASDVGAASLDNGKVDAAEASSAIVTQSASFTLALSNAGKFINADSASDITITIPAEANVAFPIGTEIEIMAGGTGVVSFAGATGVTVNSLDALTSIAGQYGVACLKKLSADTWLLAGTLL